MFPLNEKETIQNTKEKKRKPLRGAFNKYADSSKASLAL
jgi:hypothetical protein